MGDRTNVELTILASQKEKAESIFYYDKPNEDCDGNAGQWVYQFADVSYGTLEFLAALRDAGIAYDSSWESGGEYTAGTASCRFTPEGACIEKDLYDNGINPSLDKLIELIDQPDALRKYILIHQESISVLPLDEDQVKYSKLFLTHQLIGSKPVPKAD